MSSFAAGAAVDRGRQLATAHGGEGRIKAARFPARKTLEEFDFTFQRSVKKTVIEHLGQLDFLHAQRERDPARPARSCFTLHLRVQSVEQTVQARRREPRF